MKLLISKWDNFSLSMEGIRLAVKLNAEWLKDPRLKIRAERYHARFVINLDDLKNSLEYNNSYSEYDDVFKRYDDMYAYIPSNIPRNDSILLEIFDKLGDEGFYCEIFCVEVPDDIEYYIDRSDVGQEIIREQHRIWDESNKGNKCFPSFYKNSVYTSGKLI